MLQKKDMLILAELRKNSRETLTSISRKTSIPVSTIFDRIKIFNAGLIQKHTTLVDFSKLGFNARANIMVKVSGSRRDDAKKFLLSHSNVNSVYKITNGFDFLIEAIFRNLKDVEDFIETFSGAYKAEQVQVHYIVEDIKKEAFMAQKEVMQCLTKLNYSKGL